eukprot:TRINITY_DN2191_c0_g4_i1.p1 TRINITY_DN2191_c0_g4~~TRINITY_DN2191_c0_g4_i1.p1  ORF type:complete len:329 (-),score=114.15 TRINITY_DN2191_c0_g4_i1:191-1177(-)
MGGDRSRSRRRRDDDGAGARKEKKKKRSASSESAERSREREKRRRKQQQEHVNKNRAPGAVPGVPAAPGGQRMFWDGFQWVPRAETNVNPNDPNVSRKLRRLYLGNLPYHLGVTEDSFSKQLYDTMKERGMCNDPNQNPVLHVWFARDKGANYGFCEVASIEETERSLQLDGMLVLGVPISIKRPTDSTSPMGSISGMQQGMAGGGAGGGGMLALQGMQVQATSVIIHIEEILKVDSKTTRDDFDDVKEDMQEGCGAHGRISSVFIIRPEHNQRQPAVRAGDVFLKCGSVDDATKIIRAMGHRKYDARQIQMKSYSEDDYSRLIKPLM